MMNFFLTAVVSN